MSGIKGRNWGMIEWWNDGPKPQQNYKGLVYLKRLLEKLVDLLNIGKHIIGG